MRYFWLILLLQVAFAAVVRSALIQFPTSPENLAATKHKAESGDAAAQKALGDQCKESLKFSAAEHWYRAAALQGNASAICALGELYHATTGFGTNSVKANLTNALALHRLAASIGDPRSHFHLAHAYHEGKMIPRNPVLAYKHFKLAGPSIMNDVYLRQLILELSPTEINEAEKQAASFRSVPFQKAFENLVFDAIRIGGVLGNSTGRIALLNGNPIAAGESRNLTVASLPAKITCAAIEKEHVTVAFGPARRSIRVSAR